MIFRAKLPAMTEKTPDTNASKPAVKDDAKPETVKQVEEVGGPKGPDPTRFGDWSVNGRCIDF